MGIGDDIKNTAEKTVGKAKEAAGKMTGNEDLENEGRGDQAKASARQAKASARQAGEDVKDAAKNVRDNARDAFER